MSEVPSDNHIVPETPETPAAKSQSANINNLNDNLSMIARTPEFPKINGSEAGTPGGPVVGGQVSGDTPVKQIMNMESDNDGDSGLPLGVKKEGKDGDEDLQIRDAQNVESQPGYVRSLIKQREDASKGDKLQSESTNLDSSINQNNDIEKSGSLEITDSSKSQSNSPSKQSQRNMRLVSPDNVKSNTLVVNPSASKKAKTESTSKDSTNQDKDNATTVTEAGDDNSKVNTSTDASPASTNSQPVLNKTQSQNPPTSSQPNSRKNSQSNIPNHGSKPSLADLIQSVNSVSSSNTNPDHNLTKTESQNGTKSGPSAPVIIQHLNSAEFGNNKDDESGTPTPTSNVTPGESRTNSHTIASNINNNNNNNISNEGFETPRFSTLKELQKEQQREAIEERQKKNEEEQRAEIEYYQQLYAYYYYYISSDDEIERQKQALEQANVAYEQAMGQPSPRGALGAESNGNQAQNSLSKDSKASNNSSPNDELSAEATASSSAHRAQFRNDTKSQQAYRHRIEETALGHLNPDGTLKKQRSPGVMGPPGVVQKNGGNGGSGGGLIRNFLNTAGTTAQEYYNSHNTRGNSGSDRDPLLGTVTTSSPYESSTGPAFLRPRNVNNSNVTDPFGNGWSNSLEWANSNYNNTTSLSSQSTGKVKKKKTLLEFLLRKLQKPEVILMGSWWAITLILLMVMADMHELIFMIWKPLLFLIGVPIGCFGLVLVVTL